MSMTRRIQEVMLENKALRQEIEGLRRQLIASIPLQKAV
jgi:regulator of replication initiation timing